MTANLLYVSFHFSVSGPKNKHNTSAERPQLEENVRNV